MAKQRKTLYLATVVILMLIIGVAVSRVKDTIGMPFSIVLNTSDGVQKIQLWSDKKQAIYVFLPSCAELSQVQVALETEEDIIINGIPLMDGMTCEVFSVGTPHDLFYKVWGNEIHRKILFLKSENLAAVFIDTQSGSMDYVHEKKGNQEKGKLSMFIPSGETVYSGELETITGRGNYTWDTSEKKPYRLRLSEEADLVNSGAAKEWVLLANNSDPTHLKNKIVYDFSDQVGLRYSPDSEWVDLYLNGEYVGLYLLSERNEVTASRVDIYGTGSFLVSQELEKRLQENNDPYILTDAQKAFRIRYPQNTTQESRQEMQNVMQSVENAILAENGTDPISGKHWTELLDVESWTKKFLIEEVFANYDAGAVSQFYYVDGTDADVRVWAGPVWDYDLSMGIDAYWAGMSPRAFYVNRIREREHHDTQWLVALSQKEQFLRRVKDVYREEYLPALMDLLQNKIPVYREHIAKSAELNQVRWALDNHSNEDSADRLISFLQERIAFLNEIWVDEKVHCQVLADRRQQNNNYANYVVIYGEQLTDLYMFESTEDLHFLGWYDRATGEPFDVSQPIKEDMEIYAKWENTSNHLVSRIIKILPLCSMITIFFAVFYMDFIRWRPYNRKK